MTPTTAALVGDGAELLVVDVAPVLERAEHAGVADDRRLRRDRARVEEPALVDVREVDENALGFAALDELEPHEVSPSVSLRRGRTRAGPPRWQ